MNEKVVNEVFGQIRAIIEAAGVGGRSEIDLSEIYIAPAPNADLTGEEREEQKKRIAELGVKIPLG